MELRFPGLRTQRNLSRLGAVKGEDGRVLRRGVLGYKPTVYTRASQLGSPPDPDLRSSLAPGPVLLASGDLRATHMATSDAASPTALHPAGRSPRTHMARTSPTTGVRNVHAVRASRRVRRASMNQATVVAAVPIRDKKASESTNRGVQTIAGGPWTSRATPARATPPMSRCHPVAATTSRPASRRDSNVPAVTAAAATSDSAAP
jgi:hypothetical protein